MEILIGIVVLGIIWWFISNNKKSINDETVIETKRTVKIDGGEQTITRKTVINNNQTDIRTPTSPMTPPTHKIIEPTERELELQRQLEETKQRELEAKALINKLANQPTPQTVNITKQTNEQELKQCNNCNRLQPISQYRPNHNQPDGLTKWCISCLDSGEKLINPASIKGMKYCPKCRQNRRKTSFYPTKKNPDGLSKWCKYCLPKR